jgi:hypothetical protein
MTRRGFLVGLLASTSLLVTSAPHAAEVLAMASDLAEDELVEFGSQFGFFFRGRGRRFGRRRGGRRRSRFSRRGSRRGGGGDAAPAAGGSTPAAGSGRGESINIRPVPLSR